jgi:hypothetical protein
VGRQLGGRLEREWEISYNGAVRCFDSDFGVIRSWRARMAVSRPEGQEGFVELSKHWVVELSLAWLGRGRRHSKD